MPATTTQLWLPRQADAAVATTAGQQLPMRVGAETMAVRYANHPIRRNLVSVRQPGDALGFCIDSFRGDGGTTGGRLQLDPSSIPLAGLGATATGFYRIDWWFWLESGYTVQPIDLTKIARNDAGDSPNGICALTIYNASNHIRCVSMNTSNANETVNTTVAFPLRKLVRVSAALTKLATGNHQYDVVVRMIVDGVSTDVVSLTNRRAFGSAMSFARGLIRETGGTPSVRGAILGYRFVTCASAGELWDEPADYPLVLTNTSGTASLGTVYARFDHGDAEGGLGTESSPYTRADVLTSPSSALLPSGSGWRWASDRSLLELGQVLTPEQLAPYRWYIDAGLLYPDGCTVQLTNGLHRLTTRWNCNTDAISICGSSRANVTVTACKQILAAAWTLNADGLYETTDYVAGVGIRYGQRPMAAVTGANYAAVKATMIATANTFYADAGTSKIYINPPAGVNPTTSTTLFERTNHTHSGSAMFEMTSKNCWLHSMTLEFSDAKDPVSAALTGNYTFNLASTGPGLQACSDMVALWGNKHIGGDVHPADTTGARTLCWNLVVGGCNPTGVIGGASVLVTFVSSTANAVGNVSVYEDVINLGSASVPGTTGFTANYGYQFFLAHYNGGTGTPGDCGSIMLRRCDMRQAAAVEIQDAGAATLIQDCQYDFTPTGTLVTLLGCNTVTQGTPFPAANVTASFTRTVVRVDSPSASNPNHRANGTHAYDHSTLDLSGVTGAPTSCLFLTAAANIDMDHTVVILPAGKALIGDVGSNLTITGTKVIFVAPDGAGQVLFRGFASGVANRTLADMQAAGLLTDARLYPSLAAAGINVDGTLTATSPLRGTAVNGGAGPDASGRYFAARTNFGAMQDQAADGAGLSQSATLSTGSAWTGVNA